MKKPPLTKNEKINLLYKKYNDLKQKYNDLKQKYNELKQKNKQLENENNQLRQKLEHRGKYIKIDKNTRIEMKKMDHMIRVINGESEESEETINRNIKMKEESNKIVEEELRQLREKYYIHAKNNTS